MLGLDRDLDYTHTESALKIDTPPERPCEHAYTFKILRKLSK